MVREVGQGLLLARAVEVEKNHHLEQGERSFDTSTEMT